MSDYSSKARNAGDELIVSQAQSQVQTFFDELKNGTRNYRTIASLSGQIAQEYRGRCVLELLQNAHDALENADPDDPRRVSFVLTTDPDPVLLIGNSGRPFSTDDFYGMCRLGQSPKDPNKSVGNKGLGFRSVLEVSTCPEIWSTAHPEENTAFAFRFDPSMSDLVAAAAQQLDECRFDVRSPFNPELPLVDWRHEQMKQYHERLAAARLKGTDEAKEYLSPYHFPIPIEGDSSEVNGLLRTAHVTVVRLPLDGGGTGTSDEAVQSVKDQLKELDARSTVFLSQLRELIIDIDGEKRILERVVDSDVRISDSHGTRQQRLLVGCSGLTPRDNTTSLFHLWSRHFGDNDDFEQAERIRASVRHLPNRWPEVRRVMVGIAVEEAPDPVEGVFVIFLPSEMATGTGAHVNAPFYGSVNRRQINFDDAYNRLLLEYVLDLCIDTVNGLILQEPEEWRARAVIDILSSTATVGGQNWQFLDRLIDRALERNIILDEQSLVLCDDGWRLPGDARLMPDIPDDDLIGAVMWRKQAEFAVVNTVLNGRRAGVEALLEKFDCVLRPTRHEWCRTIEQVAKKVYGRKIDVTWDGFLRSLLKVLPDDLQSRPESWSDDPDPLSTANFLPTQDGRILSSSDSTVLFFQPVQSADDVSDLIDAVPDSIKHLIAFLHQDIRTREEGPRGQNTEVQKFLDGRFVQTFRREDVLRDIVLKAMPLLPAPHGRPEAELCSELFSWTMKLVAKGAPGTLLTLLERIPVACYGGWFAMTDAVFGPGWKDRHGELVWSLADELPEDAAEQLRKIALLPPDDPRWSIAVEDHSALFAQAGVFDGLRLKQAPEVSFSMCSYSYELPDDPPDGTPRPAWDNWRKAVHDEAVPYYTSWHDYTLSDVNVLPEIHYLGSLSPKGRRALSDLILASIGSWGGWQYVTVRKNSGRYWSRQITSPLKYWLKTLPWLNDLSGVLLPLRQRWLVPESLLRGQRNRYLHLDPLSLNLARKLNDESELQAAFVRLDLNVYPTEDDQIGPELLDALAKAWAADRVNPSQFDIFLGQVRDAWRHLDPEDGLPRKFLVRTAKRTFVTREPDKLVDVYLPDSRDRTRSLQEHGKHILEMRTNDATRLALKLLAATHVKRASSLEEQFFIDDAPWTDAIENIPSLDATKLTWLSVTLLTIAAQGGTNPMGAATAAWKRTADRLRRARVLECETISVRLVDGDLVVASSEPAAQWLSGDVLAIRRDVELAYECIAPAAQAMLDRQDLLKDLRLVLGALAGHRDPPLEQIEEALERADIDSDSLSDIRNRWAGNITLIVDRIRPVVVLLGIPAHGIDIAATDIDQLRDWLSTTLIQWSAQDVLSAAKRSRDDSEMGMAAWRVLGEVAQLPAWNAVLSSLGDRYIAVTNIRADEQTKAHLDEAMPLLRALARHVAVEANNPNLFLKLENKHQNFEADADWSTRWWEVSFGAVIEKLRVDYTEVIGDDSHLEVLHAINDIDDLRTAFLRNGIATAPDPYEIASLNKKRLHEMLLSTHDVHREWAEFEASESVAPSHPQPPTELDAAAYLQRWSDSELLERVLQIIDDEEFTRACNGCSSLERVRRKLELTPENIQARREDRLRREHESKRRERTFDVAGFHFEVGGDKYGDLFEHLESLGEPNGPEVNKDETTPLAETAVKGTSSGGRNTKPKKTSHLHDPAERRELVGVVGEMHAYRFLRAKFGKGVVTRDAWLSEIRRTVLPLIEGEPDSTSDGHGFDFRFTYRRRKWHVEVKATLGDDPQFNLGISEINAASNLAGRGGKWRILRVRNALSDQPEFDWLPNPFEDEFKHFFRLHRGGMTVSYTRKKHQE